MPAYISSIGTAVPENRISQSEISEFMKNHLPLTEVHKRALTVLYRASGIKYRHSVIEDYARSIDEFSFYPKNKELKPFPDLESRMKLYESEAIILAEEASKNCLNQSDFESQDITHLITVSCTGMYAPGLDIDLIERMKLKTDVVRSSVNFMGCYAAFNALKIADQIVKNDKEANVLIVCVELCSIHFQNTDDEDSLLSSTLFADGAAATMVVGKKPKGLSLEMQSFYSDLDLTAKEEMSWKIGNLGFLMRLSSNVPDTIRNGIKRLTNRLLEQIQLELSSVDYFAIHPGGKRILEVIEQELGIEKEQNHHAYETLRNFGNMSSPTVLFVLKSELGQFTKSDNNKNVLSFAFGPGLTLESMLLKIHKS
ncbi:MAG: type III polyketide synthase [Cyclobacteriaceae bacterium]